MNSEDIIIKRIKILMESYKGLDINDIEPQKVISIRLPPKLIFILDQLVLQGLFISRSEIIRTAIILFLRQYIYKSEGVKRNE